MAGESPHRHHRGAARYRHRPRRRIPARGGWLAGPDAADPRVRIDRRPAGHGGHHPGRHAFGDRPRGGRRRGGSVLRPDDVAAAPHRSHHIALAKGLAPSAHDGRAVRQGDRRARGPRRAHAPGRLRSSATSDRTASSARGSGSRWAPRSLVHRRRPAGGAGFFGDGGANTGRIWEFVNLAATWKLPLVVVCENNLYAVETPIGDAMAGDSIADRAAGFGLPAEQIDGQDVAAVYRAAATPRRWPRPARARPSSRRSPTGTTATTPGDRGRTARPTRSRGGGRRGTRSSACGPSRPGRPRRRGSAAGRAGRRPEAAVAFAESSPLPDPATVADGVPPPG